MNISIIRPPKKTFISAISALLLMSTLFAASLNTPTHALSLDLGKTVTNVTNNIPVVNTITPLLMNTPTVTVPVVTPTTTPVTILPETQTTSAVSVAPTETDTSNETTPIDTPSTISASNNAVFSPAAITTHVPAGLSVLAKQGQVLEAPAHVPSNALTYATNQINPLAAKILFYLGVSGIFIGGCVIFATRPRMRISA